LALLLILVCWTGNQIIGWNPVHDLVPVGVKGKVSIRYSWVLLTLCSNTKFRNYIVQCIWANFL